jgi:hypothetical protein
MLVITIDLVPGGDESSRRTIGSMRIANISNLADLSDYTVKRHDRRQCVWGLLAKASEEIIKADFVEL